MKSCEEPSLHGPSPVENSPLRSERVTKRKKFKARFHLPKRSFRKAITCKDFDAAESILADPASRSIVLGDYDTYATVWHRASIECSDKLELYRRLKLSQQILSVQGTTISEEHSWRVFDASAESHRTARRKLKGLEVKGYKMAVAQGPGYVPLTLLRLIIQRTPSRISLSGHSPNRSICEVCEALFAFSETHEKDIVNLLCKKFMGAYDAYNAGHHREALQEVVRSRDQEALRTLLSVCKGEQSEWYGVDTIYATAVEACSVDEVAATLEKLGFPPVESLRCAIEHGQLEQISRILGTRLEVDSLTTEGQTALMHVCSSKLLPSLTVQMAKWLVERGADVNFKHKDGKLPLCQALRYGNFDLARLLLEKGAQIKPEVLKTTFHSQAYNPENQAQRWDWAEWESLCKMIWTLCSDSSSKLHYQPLRLHLAVEERKLEAMRYFLALDADIVDYADPETGLTSLMMAAQRDSGLPMRVLMQVLLDHGANVNAQSKKGRTALHCLESRNDKEWLIRRGADPDIVSNGGKRAGEIWEYKPVGSVDWRGSLTCLQWGWRRTGSLMIRPESRGAGSAEANVRIVLREYPVEIDGRFY